MGDDLTEGGAINVSACHPPAPFQSPSDAEINVLCHLPLRAAEACASILDSVASPSITRRNYVKDPPSIIGSGVRRTRGRDGSSWLTGSSAPA